ncbi:MAG TPA: ATP-dependent DNA helicase [Candidatus Paceibacterota bacterium]|nr:ATP-dependent DNA helicase [Candidatus Paceibacterota bacterium]
MSTFAERYAALNQEQKEAVDTIEGPVMVIAGPGTGKTEILTMRIANILAKTGIAPERILALTFTESGAASMRRRLAELAGRSAYRVEISTFHGFANRIIRDYPDYFPDIVGAAGIAEIDQVDILRRLIDAADLKALRPFGDRYYYLRDILAAINELKRQGIPPERFAAIAEDGKKDFYANPDLVNQSGKNEGKMKTKYAAAAKYVEKNLELAEIYRAYQAALRKAKQYDYSDMIMYVALALEKDGELRDVLQDAYEYFLVDEHQDTNDAQNRIIEWLAAGPAPNLFVVGDERQAIFRFQGASLENFHYFAKKYAGVKLVSLRGNYRSTQAILDAAQGVSPRETELFAVSRAARHPADPPAHLAVLPSPDAEYFFIARKIKELIAAGEAPEEIAVLYRDNRDAAPLARMLEKESIPFTIESDQDVLGDPEIRKLVRLLRAVRDFGNDAALAEALHADFLGVEPMEVYRLAVTAHRERVKIYDILRRDQPALFAKFSAWKRAAENRGAVEAFEEIVRGSGFLAAVLQHPSAAEKLAKLHALFDLLRSLVERHRNYTLKEFFTYLDLMEEHGVAIKASGTVRLPGRVRLMTAHRSKGLEFDRVFIVNAVDRKWGSRFHRENIKLPKRIYRVLESAAEGGLAKGGDSDGDADERNVFYVALTRARREVFVTLSKTDRDGKEQLPTPFIAELKEDVLTPFDTAAYEAEFAAHREIEFAPAAPATPDLADREFLNALFEEQGLSVTALNNYLACPWRYFYLNLVRIPEAPNKHLSFGNAVHAALRQYFDALDGGEDRGKAYLVARFEEALAREPLKESEFGEALEKGKRALPAFYDEYHAAWTGAGGRGLNELRVEGAVGGGGDAAPVKIKGSLDRVEFLDGNQVRVIDYKTGRPKTRNEIEGNTKTSDGNYRRQLVFYRLLLDKEGRRDMREGVVQFIEPDGRGRFRREAFAVTPGEVIALEGQIVQAAREIRELSFFGRFCDDAGCRYCALRRGLA